jgi:hypothetical protein
MAFPELKIVCGATEAILANPTAGVYRQRYVPATPSDVNSDVTEPAELLVDGYDTGVALQQSVNRLFKKARQYAKSKVGDPVYVYYRLGDTGPYYRSEIRDGRCELPPRTLGAHLRGDLFPFQVIWTREPRWRSTTLSTVQLTNGNGTNQVNLTLDNDGNHYANISSGAITGDLPTPALIEITNNEASVSGVFRIGHGYILNTSQAWLIQGESAGSGTANGSSSGGEYRALNVTTSDTSLLDLTLSSTLLDNARRGWFRLVARFTGNPTGAVRLKPQLLYGSNVLSPGKWVRTTANQELLDLGEVQLPPYESGGNSAALTLRLRGKADSNTTVNLDYIVCMPIDGWRKLVPVNTGLVGTHTLVDDGPAGRVYEIVGTDQVNTYAAYGSPILLEPNTAQKFLIVQADANGAAGISREITLSVSYYRQTVTL